MDEWQKLDARLADISSSAADVLRKLDAISADLIAAGFTHSTSVYSMDLRMATEGVDECMTRLRNALGDHSNWRREQREGQMERMK